VAVTTEVPGKTGFTDGNAASASNLVSESEAALVESLRNGENQGFETLVRTFGPQVMAVARRYLNSEADAADCFQETFVAVFTSIGSFAGQSSLRQWVRGVAVNQSLMALRKRKRGREESIDHMLPQFDESGSRIETAEKSSGSTVEKQIDSASLQRNVRHSIDQLPDDYRVVLLLRDIDGLNTRETADILGIQLNAVKTRLHRARSALRYILQPVLEQIDYDADM
jgi:RNA polymerase sigma-70 factor (ECF subfamily)